MLKKRTVSRNKTANSYVMNEQIAQLRKEVRQLKKAMKSVQRDMRDRDAQTRPEPILTIRRQRPSAWIRYRQDYPSQVRGYNDAARGALSSSMLRTIKGLADIGGKGDATQVAKKTLRSRSVETIYLNSLERLKVLDKGREGRRVVYSTNRKLK